MIFFLLFFIYLFFLFIYLFIYLFFVPYFSAGLSGKGVHSLASSFILAFFQHCLSFNRNISWFQLLWQVNITFFMSSLQIKAFLYVHDIELVEIGVWWTMSVCFLVLFFFYPTRPKYREIKNGKKKKKKKAIMISGTR